MKIPQSVSLWLKRCALPALGLALATILTPGLAQPIAYAQAPAPEPSIQQDADGFYEQSRFNIAMRIC